MARILVIDDDQSIQMMLTAVLEEDGHAVTTVGDGDTGLKAALANVPDLIVTDMSLPLKTGWDVIAQLKADALTRAVPIIALSAYDSQANRDAGYEAGCDVYVGKPIDLAVLMKNVRALLA